MGNKTPDRKARFCPLKHRFAARDCSASGCTERGRVDCHRAIEPARLYIRQFTEQFIRLGHRRYALDAG